MAPTKLIDTSAPASECAVYVTEDPNGVCARPETIKKIADLFEIKNEEPIKTMKAAAERLGVEEQSEVLAAVANQIPDAAVDLKTRVKPSGPADTTALLSNSNIDNVMDQWEIKWRDFLHVPFQFINFASADTYYMNKKYYINNLDDFKPVEAYAAGYRTLGCVLNTDTGPPGKHWVCVFVDMRGAPWTIEYFNSSGNPPPIEVINWEFKIKTQMMMEKKLPGDVEIVRVTSIQHQKSKTECGVYCLYYIFNRLKNRPYSLFSNNIVEDEDMIEFREHLFI